MDVLHKTIELAWSVAYPTNVPYHVELFRIPKSSYHLLPNNKLLDQRALPRFSHMLPFWCPRVLYKNHDHRIKSLLDFAIANQAFRLHSLVFGPFLDTQALLSLYRSTT